jgi:hypothetical protein
MRYHSPALVMMAALMLPASPGSASLIHTLENRCVRTVARHDAFFGQ